MYIIIDDCNLVHLINVPILICFIDAYIYIYSNICPFITPQQYLYTPITYKALKYHGDGKRFGSKAKRLFRDHK